MRPPQRDRNIENSDSRLSRRRRWLDIRRTADDHSWEPVNTSQRAVCKPDSDPMVGQPVQRDCGRPLSVFGELGRAIDQEYYICPTVGVGENACQAADPNLRRKALNSRPPDQCCFGDIGKKWAK